MEDIDTNKINTIIESGNIEAFKNELDRLIPKNVCELTSSSKEKREEPTIVTQDPSSTVITSATNVGDDGATNTTDDNDAPGSTGNNDTGNTGQNASKTEKEEKKNDKNEKKEKKKEEDEKKEDDEKKGEDESYPSSQSSDNHNNTNNNGNDTDGTSNDNENGEGANTNNSQNIGNGDNTNNSQNIGNGDISSNSNDKLEIYKGYIDDIEKYLQSNPGNNTEFQNVINSKRELLNCNSPKPSKTINNSNSNMKWGLIGGGIGLVVIILCLVLFSTIKKRNKKSSQKISSREYKLPNDEPEISIVQLNPSQPSDSSNKTVPDNSLYNRQPMSINPMVNQSPKLSPNLSSNQTSPVQRNMIYSNENQFNNIPSVAPNNGYTNTNIDVNTNSPIMRNIRNEELPNNAPNQMNLPRFPNEINKNNMAFNNASFQQNQKIVPNNLQNVDNGTNSPPSLPSLPLNNTSNINGSNIIPTENKDNLLPSYTDTLASKAQPNEHVFVAQYYYNPVFNDEFQISPGDVISFGQCTYDDGWAHGNNLSKETSGVFPLGVVIKIVDVDGKNQDPYQVSEKYRSKPRSSSHTVKFQASTSENDPKFEKNSLELNYLLGKINVDEYLYLNSLEIKKIEEMKNKKLEEMKNKKLEAKQVSNTNSNVVPNISMTSNNDASGSNADNSCSSSSSNTKQ